MSSIPRRPKGESGAASKLGASQRATSHADPQDRDGVLSAFLGGAAKATFDPEDALAVALRSVLKRNETTKLKALLEIEAAFQTGTAESVPDDKLIMHAGSFSEAFRQCSNHESPNVRRRLCRCMAALMGRPKEVKAAVARELSAIFGPWLCLVNDNGPDVSADATVALDVAFPSDERKREAVKRFGPQAIAFAISEITSATGTPLPSDVNDVRVNTVCACFGLLSTVVRIVADPTDSVRRTAWAAFTNEESIRKCIPPTGAKGGPLAKSAASRMALIRALSSIVQDTQTTEIEFAFSQTVARSCVWGCFDSDDGVSAAAWTLMLTWLKCHGDAATKLFPRSCLDSLPSFIAEGAKNAISPDFNPQSLHTALSALMPLTTLGSRMGIVTDTDVSALLAELDQCVTLPWNQSTGKMFVAWLEVWSTTVTVAQLAAASMHNALSPVIQRISQHERLLQTDTVAAAVSACVVRFAGRVATAGVAQTGRFLEGCGAFCANAFPRSPLGASVYALTVSSCDRLSSQSESISSSLPLLLSGLRDLLEAVLQGGLKRSAACLIQLGVSTPSTSACVMSACVDLLNTGSPDCQSLMANLLVENDDCKDMLAEIALSLTCDAQNKLVEMFDAAGKHDRIPDNLKPAASALLLQAMHRRDWSACCALITSSVSAQSEVTQAFQREIRQLRSVDELSGVLSAVEGYRATGADVEPLLSELQRKIVDVMPAWVPEAFASSELEEPEATDEDDEESADEIDAEGDEDSTSHTVDSTSAADLSIAAATALSAEAAHSFVEICGRTPACASLVNELASSVVSMIVEPESSSVVRSGRPSQVAALAVLKYAEGATSQLLDGARFLALVSDCFEDLADLPLLANQLCAERGSYSRHTLRKALFRQPTAACGLMLSCAAELLSLHGAAGVRHASSWLIGIAKMYLIESVITARVVKSLDAILTAVFAAANADEVFEILKADSQGPQLGRALTRAVLGSDGLSTSARTNFVMKICNCAIDEIPASADGRRVALLHAMLTSWEDAGAGLMTKRASEVTCAKIGDLVHTTTEINIVTKLLQALRMMSPRPGSLNPALLTHAVNLRETSPSERSSKIALIGELMLWSCTDSGLATEIAIAGERCVTTTYNLSHLPTNGKLGQRTPMMVALPIEVLRQTSRALRTMRKGLVRLSTMHGTSAAQGALTSLRTTLNIADLDIACESVLRLKSATAQNISELIDALSDISATIGAIKPDDVRTLRSSAQSVAVAANLAASLHFWLCARPSKSFEQEFDEVALQRVIALVNRVSAVTLVESEAPVALLTLMPVMVRGPVKPLPGRGNASPSAGGGDLRPRLFQRHLVSCTATSKARLSLQTYFAAWYAGLTNERELAAAARESRAPDSLSQLAEVPFESAASVYQLLDIILALAHSRPEDTGGKRSYISDALTRKDVSHALGFDFNTFAACPSDNSARAAVVHLSLCAFSLLSLLMQRRTVRFVRSWIEGLHRSLRAGFEAFVESNLSPALTQMAFSEVLAHSPNGSLKFDPEEFKGLVTLTVLDSARTVMARFTADDVAFDVKFTLPTTYPLRAACVDPESIKAKTRAGVPADKWRAWMLKVSVMLVNGGSTVWGCVTLIAENLEKQLEGVDPCPICYSVVSQVTHKLPEMSCLVCKNSKFHSQCLYEWWGNSGQTSCPMCRSPWFSS